MPNDINKLKRLMYAANHLKKENPVILKGRKITSSQALKYAWWFESFRAKLASGVYRFSYFKIDGSIREAVGTLNFDLIPEEHHPKSLSAARSDSSEKYSSFCYYDLIPEEHHPKSLSAARSDSSENYSSFCYYDLYANGDTGGWRSFRLDLFIGFVEEMK